MTKKGTQCDIISLAKAEAKIDYWQDCLSGLIYPLNKEVSREGWKDYCNERLHYWSEQADKYKARLIKAGIKIVKEDGLLTGVIEFIILVIRKFFNI
jgi:hypothetical protein